MDLSRARRRFADERSAYLATVGHGGPHLVPIVFAVVGDTIVTAIDHKPKSTRHLRRLANIATDPRVAVLVDHYDEEWSELWWIRADGRATVSPAATVRAEVDALVAKYAQYAERRPADQVIVIEVHRWRSWQAEDPKAE